MKKPALFLDRDGVINYDYGYVHTLDNFVFLDGIFEVVPTANKVGFLVVVVTNQAGIGRGYYSEAQFHVLTDWMKMRFVQNNGKIDAVYYCPYHPVYGIGSYRLDSYCRKPFPGMLLHVQRDLSIDFSKSILVGDSFSDMEAGHRAGLHKLLFLNGIADGCVSINSNREILPFLTSSSC